jgi:RNA polymerase sigma-70 factor (sigma-E family)
MIPAAPKPVTRLTRLLVMRREVGVVTDAAASSGVEAEGGGRTSAAGLAALYERHSPAAYRLAYLLTGEPALAEDLVQDAFVRLIGRFTRLRDPDAFDAYLRRTVINLSHSTLRRRRVERAHLHQQAVLSGRSDTDQRDVETADELWRQLRQLAPRQRTALVLRYYEDLSEQQTADLLGCPVRTVKSLVARGLAAMRAQQKADR